MPAINREVLNVSYNQYEISNLILNDLKNKGLVSDKAEIIQMVEIEDKVGKILLNNFDTEPVYGFGGLRLDIAK